MANLPQMILTRKAVIYCDNSSDYGKGLAQYLKNLTVMVETLAQEGFVKDDQTLEPH